MESIPPPSHPQNAHLLKVPHVLVELEARVTAGVLLQWWVNAYHIKLRAQVGKVVLQKVTLEVPVWEDEYG